MLILGYISKRTPDALLHQQIYSNFPVLLPSLFAYFVCSVVKGGNTGFIIVFFYVHVVVLEKT